MTRTEYMDMLKEALRGFDAELGEEIMEDYRQHFDEGGRLGRTDEEIIKELGSIEDMIQDLKGGGEGKLLSKSAVSPETGQLVGGTQEDHAPAGQTCRAVVLDCKSADIIAGRSVDDRIHVSYKSSAADRNKFDFYQYEENGTFYAGQKEKQGFIFGMGGFRTVLDIKIPDHLQKLAVTVSSGDVTIDGISAEEGHATSKSGDISVCRSVLSTAVLSTNSGDVTLEALTASSGEFSSLSGDIDIHVSSLSTVVLSTSSGDLTVDGSEIEAGKLSAKSGDISVKNGDIQNLACETGSGDITVRAHTVPYVALRTRSGDIRLTMKEAEGLEAAIKCRAGDASVNFKGQRRKGIKNETLRFGDGSCKVAAETISGDISVFI